MKKHGVNSAIRLFLIAALVFAFTALSLTGCSSPAGPGGDGRDLIDIEVTSTKTAYNYGDALDYTAIQVVAKYSDGTSETIATGLNQSQLNTAGVSVTGYNPNNVGSQTITVSYKGFSRTFTVTVFPPASTGDPDMGWYYDNGAESETFFDIYNADELAGLAKLVNEGVQSFHEKVVTIKADLNLSAYGVDESSTGYKGWNPIGIDDTHPFEGTLVGGKKTIIGLSIDNNTDYQGLFGILEVSATVQDLTLTDVNISGSTNVGGMAGMNYGILLNCAVSGDVTGTYNVGGVAGYIYSGDVTNCYSAATVKGTSDNVGGVAGFVYNESKVENCYATGNVKSDGGCVGGVAGSCEADSVVQNCYATGDVEGDYNVGGVVGAIDGSTVQYCYATGAVKGDNENVGGVVGGNFSGTVEYCVALNSSVTGAASTTKRVVGLNDNGGGIDSNFAFRGIALNDSFVIGDFSDNPNGQDKSAAEITKYTFFFVAFWKDIINGGPWKWGTSIGGSSYNLPILDWQTSAPVMPGHIKDVTLTLASGSNGTADFGKITGLTSGLKYIVNEGTNWYPVNNLGQLGASTTIASTAITSSVALTVTTITGSGGAYLDFSKTWNVWQVLGSETTSLPSGSRNTYITESMDVYGSVSDGVTIVVATGKTITVPKNLSQRTLTLNGNAKIILERNSGVSSAYLCLEGGTGIGAAANRPGKLVFAGADAAAPECTYNGSVEVKGAPGKAADVVRFPVGTNITGLTTDPRKVKALVGGSTSNPAGTAHLTIMASNPYEATISRDTLFALAE